MKYSKALCNLSIVTLSASSLTLLKGELASAFTINPPQRTDVSEKYFTLPVNGGTGNGVVRRKEFGLLPIPAPTTQDAPILDFLNAQTSGYVFRPGNELNGGFFPIDYYVCAPNNQGIPCGRDGGFLVA
jgi:hypothetical protein